MVVITSAIDSGDGVFIGGKHPHNTFKPMTNTELTLDQLTAIAGGGVFAKLDSFQDKGMQQKSIGRGGKDNGVLVKIYCPADADCA